MNKYEVMLEAVRCDERIGSVELPTLRQDLLSLLAREAKAADLRARVTDRWRKAHRAELNAARRERYLALARAAGRNVRPRKAGKGVEA